MNRTIALTLSLAAGLLGGALSRLTPTTLFAQAKVTVPKEVRAQRFTLVDENGRIRGTFAIENPAPTDGVEVIKGAGDAVIKLFDSNGREIFHAGPASTRSLSQR